MSIKIYYQVDDYDFDNENDVSEFCPSAAAPSEGHDAEYPLENAGNKLHNFMANTRMYEKLNFPSTTPLLYV